jgi:hypothetical protein
MKFDENNLNVRKLRKMNAAFRWNLDSMILAESKNTLYSKEYVILCNSIITRMQNHEKIITDKPIQWGTITEKQLYEKLLNDDKTSGWLVTILNSILEYKRQEEFLRNIVWTWKAVKWWA